jgi:hypothetical protein
MMETASTYEMSLNFYQTTRRNVPEHSDLYSRSFCQEQVYFLQIPGFAVPSFTSVPSRNQISPPVPISHFLSGYVLFLDAEVVGVQYFSN